MFRFWRSLIPQKARRPGAGELPRIPDGRRVYAIGDVHGERELLAALLAEIEADDAARDPAHTTIILLGDLIDRGPDSAGVLALCRAFSATRDVRILCGNHEEMFLAALDDDDVLRSFLQYGGRETILSYQIDLQDYNDLSVPELRARLPEIVPVADIDFIRTFENVVIVGDYAFVHAGIRPGVAMVHQKIKELRWIREPFLSASSPHDHFVIHGHSISEEVDVRANRMGIDTGAYLTGRLTALCLEGTERRILTATPAGIARRTLST